MRAWKIHFFWALVALGASGAWGRWSVSQRETVLRERERAVSRPLPSPTPAPPSLPLSLPVSSAPPPALEPAGIIRLPADFHLLPDPMDVPLDEIRTLLKSNDIRKLQRAFMGIGSLKDRALKRELLLDLVRSPQQSIRRMALDQLAQEGGEEVIQPLQDVLKYDSEPYFRSLAAKHLGGLPDKGTVALLIEAYRDGDENMQISAAGSLYRFGHPGEVADLAPRIARDLDSPDGSVRKDAVERLGRLQSPLTIPFLARALRDSNGDVRSEAVSALGDLDAPDIPSLLEPLLQDPFSDVREYAQDALESYRKRHPK